LEVDVRLFELLHDTAIPLEEINPEDRTRTGFKEHVLLSRRTFFLPIVGQFSDRANPQQM
jgi:hypothetical protein